MQGDTALGIALGGVLVQQLGAGTTVFVLGAGLLGLTTLMTVAPYVRAAPPHPRMEGLR